MNKCPNCGTQLSCSCQVRVASNGTKVCSKCITSYEVNNANAQNTIKNLAVIDAAVLPTN